MTSEHTPSPGGKSVEVMIHSLGAQGDGIAALPDGQPLYVTGALPGEKVEAQPVSGQKYQLVSVITPASDRVEPPCPLFQSCGGCTLQHMSLPAILEWKTQRVVYALKKAGFSDTPVPAQRQVPVHSRRRADLAIRRNGKNVLVGLHARSSDQVIDLTSCTIMHPTLMAALSSVRQTLQSLEGLRQAGEIQLNLLESGLDILLTTDGPLSSGDRTRLASLSATISAPRISWYQRGTEAYETVAQSGPVYHTMAGVTVALPPGAFLQATAPSETWIQDAVLSALPKKIGKRDKIIELYAGCGTLSLPLAAHHQVFAYEGYAPAAACLKAVSGGTRLNVECRDLNRQPVMGTVLKAANVVVLDPPHSGAGLQMRQLTTGKPQHIIYVSCNPAALAKDAKALHDAGYRLNSLEVIDQFLWSAETEVVCSFTHGSSRRSRSGLSR